jgi:hypothetical protein
MVSPPNLAALYGATDTSTFLGFRSWTDLSKLEAPIALLGVPGATPYASVGANLLSGAPFCSPAGGLAVGTACTDIIDGFDFKFTGENILGVTVDPSSAAAFLSATFGSHLGLQRLSNNEIQVDVTGDLPLVNDQLFLDLIFVAPPPPPPHRQLAR